MSSSIEGKWYGPDKVAHFLFPIAVSGQITVFSPADAGAGVVLAMLLGLLWEASNYYYVFDGERGVSILDALAFCLGGVVAALLAYAATQTQAGA